MFNTSKICRNATGELLRQFWYPSTLGIHLCQNEMRLVALKHLLKKWPVAKPKALNVQVLFWTMCDRNMLLCMLLFCQITGKGFGISGMTGGSTMQSKNHSYMYSKKAVHLHGYGLWYQIHIMHYHAEYLGRWIWIKNFKPTSEHIHIDSCFWSKYTLLRSVSYFFLRSSSQVYCSILCAILCNACCLLGDTQSRQQAVPKQQSLVNSLGQGCVEVEAADGGAAVPGPQPK